MQKMGELLANFMNSDFALQIARQTMDDAVLGLALVGVHQFTGVIMGGLTDQPQQFRRPHPRHAIAVMMQAVFGGVVFRLVGGPHQTPQQRH